MTLTAICGAECQKGSTADTVHVFTVGVDASISTSTVRSGLRSWRNNPTASNLSHYWFYNIGNDATVTARIYFRYASLPTIDTAVCGGRSNTANKQPALVYDQSEGKVFVGMWNNGSGTIFSTAGSGRTITTNVWYRVDMRFNLSANPWVIDMSLDGISLGQYTEALSVSFIEGIFFGPFHNSQTTVTLDVFYDDFAYDNDTAAYPIGPGKISSYIPSADGTHNVAGANDFERSATGTDITNATTTAFQLVDDRPLKTGVLTEYINLIAPPNATDYVELDFESTSEVVAPKAVAAIMAYGSASVAVNNLRYALRDSNGATQADARNADSGVGTTANYSSTLFTSIPGGGAWTLTAMNALRARLYTSDANPDPWVGSLMLEAEFITIEAYGTSTLPGLNASGSAIADQPPSATGTPSLPNLTSSGVAEAHSQFSTDFTEYTDDVQPSGWTERWNTGNGTAVVKNSGLPSGASGKCLLIDVSTSSRYALSWDTPGTISGDVEILIRWQTNSVSSDRARVGFVHGSGGVGSENAYFVRSDGLQHEMWKLVAGTGTGLDIAGPTITANAWYWTRIQRSGTTIQAKTWIDGSAEPGSWDPTATDSDLSSGWVGTGGFFDTEVLYIDWFSVGVGSGTQAPPMPFSASGTPSLPGLNASGSALHSQTATGSDTLPNLTASGQAVMIPSATGAGILPGLNSSGAAVHSQIATGSPSLNNLTAIGTAVQTQSATGVSTLNGLNSSGTALHTQSATGADTLPNLTASGSANSTLAPEASGSPSLPNLVASGSATQTQVATGSATLPNLVASGVTAHLQSASGTTTLPGLNAAGSAFQTQQSSGAASLPSVISSGIAVHSHSASGAASLPNLTATASATHTQTASGQDTLPNLTASGSAVLVPSATGAPSLPGLSSSGSALQSQTGTSAVALPALTSQGQAVLVPASQGSPSLPSVFASGSSVLEQISSGSPSLPSLVASGQAVLIPEASGSVSLGSLSATGQAIFGDASTATGEITLPSLVASGDGIIPFAAIGVTTLPNIVASGNAVISQDATGQVTLPGLVASGQAIHSQSASGQDTLPSLTALGQAVQTQSASGTDTLPSLIASGTAIAGDVTAATGQVTLPSLVASGSSLVGMSASGAPSLPGLVADGQALADTAVAGIVIVSLPNLTASGIGFTPIIIDVEPILDGFATLDELSEFDTWPDKVDPSGYIDDVEVIIPSGFQRDPSGTELWNL